MTNTSPAPKEGASAHDAQKHPGNYPVPDSFRDWDPDTFYAEFDEYVELTREYGIREGIYTYPEGTSFDAIEIWTWNETDEKKRATTTVEFDGQKELESPVLGGDRISRRGSDNKVFYTTLDTEERWRFVALDKMLELMVSEAVAEREKDWNPQDDNYWDTATEYALQYYEKLLDDRPGLRQFKEHLVQTYAEQSNKAMLAILNENDVEIPEGIDPEDITDIGFVQKK